MMKKLKFFIIVMLLLGLSACGSTEKEPENTEKLNVGAGISFESEGAADNGNSVIFDVELTAADLEGMTESVVEILKHADVYSKPSKSSSAIGALDAKMNVAIYGLTEDQKWMVVSYNGRVGYIVASAFEREIVQNQTVIVPTPQTNTNNTTTTRPSTGNSNTGNSNTGSSQRPGTESSENSNSGTTDRPSTGDSQVPSGGVENDNNSDNEQPGSSDGGSANVPESGGGATDEPDSEIPDVPGDGGESNEGEEPPQNTDPPEEPTDDPIETPEIPDGSESISEGNIE